MKKQTKEAIIGFSVALAAIVITFTVLKAWSETPIVAVDESERCAWMRVTPDFEKRVCPLVLPAKYEKVYVHYNDAVGVQK